MKSLKKTMLTLILCGLALTVKSQNASVEESIFEIQTGVIGVWAINEMKLSNEFVLRSEIGMDANFWNNNNTTKSKFLMTPVITLEPKWYYNLDKRVAKSKNISGNSGNSISLQVSYNPNWFVISNADNIKVPNQVSIIPTWAIKRNLGEHFTYEAGIGIGYEYIFNKSLGGRNYGDLAANAHLRIGYRL